MAVNQESLEKLGRFMAECFQQEGAPWGAPSTGRGSQPWHLGLDRVGCLGFTHGLSGAWQARSGDHVWEKRCSGLDLLGCDPGPGHAARGIQQAGIGTGVSLSAATGWRSRHASAFTVVCRIVGAPPLCAPARVIPGRTLLEGEGRVGSRASPQLQCRPLCSWRWPQGVPVPVPAETQSAQRFTGLPIAIEVGVPQTQQLPGPWGGAIGDGCGRLARTSHSGALWRCTRPGTADRQRPGRLPPSPG
jgi:hypothetical protein